MLLFIQVVICNSIKNWIIVNGCKSLTLTVMWGIITTIDLFVSSYYYYIIKC